MRGNLAGRFALALGLAGTVATLACGASPSSPTSQNPDQGGPPHPTYTGLLAWASPPYRSVKVVADPHLGSTDAHFTDGATVSGIDSIDAIFDAYRLGYRLTVELTFVGPSTSGDATAVRVLQVLPPVAADDQRSWVAGPRPSQKWNDVWVVYTGAYTMLLLDPATVFRPDSEFASLNQFMAFLDDPGNSGVTLCSAGDGFAIDYYLKRLSSIRVWRSSDPDRECPRR